MSKLIELRDKLLRKEMLTWYLYYEEMLPVFKPKKRKQLEIRERTQKELVHRSYTRRSSANRSILAKWHWRLRPKSHRHRHEHK